MRFKFPISYCCRHFYASWPKITFRLFSAPKLILPGDDDRRVYRTDKIRSKSSNKPAHDNRFSRLLRSVTLNYSCELDINLVNLINRVIKNCNYRLTLLPLSHLFGELIISTSFTLTRRSWSIVRIISAHWMSTPDWRLKPRLLITWLLLSQLSLV